MILHPPSSRERDVRVLQTLQHAANAPYYRKRWPSLDRAPSSRAPKAEALLFALPTLHKPEAAAHQSDLVVPTVAAHQPGLEAGVVSSSTTREGRPLRVLRSPEEFYLPLKAEPGGEALPEEPAAPPPLTTLQLFSPKHGVRPPSPDRILLPAVLHPNTTDVLLDLWHSHRDTLQNLVAPLAALKWITVALVERGVDPGRFGIEAIGTTGYPLTPAARRWLEDAWMCPLFDNFSLSEVPSFATECESCGAFHWESDDVILEICAFDHDEKCARRTGELVITTLAPSVLRMPLIRYRTGDIVERAPVCEAAGRAGFFWLGRRAHSILRDNALVVGSKTLLDFGEAHPEIAQHPHPAETLKIVPHADIGVPKILATDARVDVELRFDPARFPGRAASLAVALRTECFKKGAAIDIRLVRPGTLEMTQHARKL